MWTVRVQIEDFDVGAEDERLQGASPEVGAVVSFVGTVRGGEVRSMTLEHYPGMTEKSLEALVEEARRRWSLIAVTVIVKVCETLRSTPPLAVPPESCTRATKVLLPLAFAAGV